ncbi:MAG: hypothetical protein M3270_01720 [Thermoproteota archaeon]|nr:hypothetical protein [Thermoproteota archaeon]
MGKEGLLSNASFASAKRPVELIADKSPRNRHTLVLSENVIDNHRRLAN